MAGISTNGISPDSPESPKWLKIVWTAIAMGVGYVMIASVGVDGVKIIANFGGMFAALIIAAAAGSLIVLIKRHKKYDITE
jgi:choline-glycine betaine transporter